MSVISQDTWVVIVKTGNKDQHSGTHTGVNLTIFGSAGTSRELEITDYLCRNQTQTFTFTNVGNVGVVSSLHVRLGPGTDGWDFESITLQNGQSQYPFVYSDWLSNYGTKYPQEVKLDADTGKFYIHIEKSCNILVLGDKSQKSHFNRHKLIIYKN